MAQLPFRVSSVLLALASSVALAAPCTDLPVLFIVQDKSGSMAGAPDGTAATASNPSKWTSASVVVPALAQQFASRFKFGVGMFPGANTSFNCSTGSVVSPVPSTASQVAAAYANGAPGGGTPTAVSLRAAKAYLSSLGASSTANVLLITDGMPNCNLANDPATCATTTFGCANTSTCSGSSCCGLGAKDCLDDANSEGAAGELRAAGYKVYVVGFGANLAGGNNKVVLDAIAAAGGTGSAYQASNQAALSSALNAIAASTATCCQNVCTQGATQCGGSGTVQTCQLDPSAGCTSWVSSSCPASSVCSGGTCQACSNLCTAGAVRCSSGGDVEQCVAGAGGCTGWTTVKTCGYGELCAGAACGSCQGCSIGASRCTATGVEECSWNVFSGCTQWQASACASGSTCQGGACATCNGACTAGSKRCTGKTPSTCVVDANGCTSWQPASACATFCSGGQCGVCGPTCTAGETRCNGNGVEACGADANACVTWGALALCQANEFCAGGACLTCATNCTQGSKRCAANGMIEQCGLERSGCHAWLPVSQCYLAGGEQCVSGACIPPCHDACNEGAGQCLNDAPQTCVRQPTGCTQWAQQPACAAGTTCLDGACRGPCANDEFSTCPTAMICTGVPHLGPLCLPDHTATDAGSGAGLDGGSGGGAGSGAGVDAGASGAPGSSESVGARAAGCGCTAFEGSAAPLLAVALSRLRRRRKS